MWIELNLLLPQNVDHSMDVCKANGQKAGLAPPMYQAADPWRGVSPGKWEMSQVNMDKYWNHMEINGYIYMYTHDIWMYGGSTNTHNYGLCLVKPSI